MFHVKHSRPQHAPLTRSRLLSTAPPTRQPPAPPTQSHPFAYSAPDPAPPHLSLPLWRKSPATTLLPPPASRYSASSTYPLPSARRRPLPVSRQPQPHRLATSCRTPATAPPAHQLPPPPPPPRPPPPHPHHPPPPPTLHPPPCSEHACAQSSLWLTSSYPNRYPRMRYFPRRIAARPRETVSCSNTQYWGKWLPCHILTT